MSSIWLNISTLSDLYFLFVSLTSSLILGQDHLNKILFQALIDSKSTHCFVSLKFVNTYYLKIFATPSVTLHLFDSSLNSTISKTTNLPIIFPTSDCMNLDFYITCQEYSMKYIYSTSQISKLSLTLCTFNITSSVAGLFLTSLYLILSALWSLDTTGSPNTTHWLTR